MKTCIVAIAFLAKSAFAGIAPELSLNIKDGCSGDIPSALSPSLSWKGEAAEGVNVGATIDLDTGVDVMGAKKSLWANLAKGVAGGSWTLNLRGEYSEHKYNYDNDAQRGLYLSVEANDEDESSFVWFAGSACTSGASPLKIGGKKVIEIDAVGKIMVEPRYNFEDGVADACLGIEKGDTRAYLTLSGQDQNLKIVKPIGDSMTASIKAGTASGFMYAKIDNKSGLGASTLTVTSDDVDLELKQDGWTAGINVAAPFGLESAPQVRFGKKLAFFN